MDRTSGLASITAAQADRTRRRHVLQFPPPEPSCEVIDAKLHPPPLGPEVMARPRLEERLSLGMQRGLTLLSAPAGFGKTTLLTQWCEHRTLPFAWLSLDADDNDPVRFWTHVIGALRCVRPSVGGDALDLLWSERTLTAQLFVTRLLHEVSAVPEEILLVLDGYETIKDKTIQDGMSTLLYHDPSCLKPVIATRAIPALPLARLRASGRLLELDVQEMALSTDETVTYVRDILKLTISADEISVLERCSEGWIVGLRLASLALQSGNDARSSVDSFSGGHRYVSDYFAEEVLGGLPASVRRFLLQTSILDHLEAALCDAVSGGSHGQRMLERLERDNLFVRCLDQQRHSYRYHRLFRSHLSASLQRSKRTELQTLHRRACEWYRKQGMIEEAVPHALSAGDFELAAALIGESSVSILGRGDAAMILSWLRSIPPEIAARPQLAITEATALLLSGQADAAEARLRTAERGLGPPAGACGGVPAAHSTIEQPDYQVPSLNIMASRATIAAVRRDLPRLLDLSRQAFDLSERPDAWTLENLGAAYRWSGNLAEASQMLLEASRFSSATGQTLIAVVACSNLARVRVAQGLLHEAATIWEQAIQLAGKDGQGRAPLASRPILGLAALSYEWNKVDVATKLVAEGAESAKRGGLLDILLHGQGLSARLHLLEGDIEGALGIMERVEQVARQNNLTQELSRIGVLRARLWLAQGNLAAANQWASESGLSPDDEPTYDREGGHVTLARLLVEQGKALQAIPLLSRMLDLAIAKGRVGSTIKIRVTMALALHAAGRMREALESLAQSISLAEPEGYVRTFADAGPVLASLLTKFLDPRLARGLCCDSKGYVRSLLETFDRARPLGFGDEVEPRIHASLLDLTERETDVLKLIAAGKSPREIAECLVLSLNTVKTHMSRIYEKLDAHAAAEAVANARSRQLL